MKGTVISQKDVPARSRNSFRSIFVLPPLSTSISSSTSGTATADVHTERIGILSEKGLRIVALPEWDGYNTNDDIKYLETNKDKHIREFWTSVLQTHRYTLLFLFLTLFSTQIDISNGE
jgi:hypothetical protein